MTDQGTIWLTQEAYDKLQAELEDLRGPRRQEIIEKIAAARDEGDLKENSGYHAAKDDQGKQEARDPPARGHAPSRRGGRDARQRRRRRARHGRDRRLRRRRRAEKFLLGARENLTEGDNLDVYSPQSAMGAAINGKTQGRQGRRTPRPTARSSVRSSTRSPTGLSPVTVER